LHKTIHNTQVSDFVYKLVGGDDEASRIAASPSTYFSRTPTYLFQGKLDSIVPATQISMFFQKIKNSNHNNQFILFKNSGHIFNQADYNQTIIESIQFINENTHGFNVDNSAVNKLSIQLN
jgi:dipeptidyl aminopeptidase/acylaminoacyl peptidase